MRKKTTTTTETYNDDGKLIKRVTEIVDEDSESVLKQRVENGPSVEADWIATGTIKADCVRSPLMEGFKAGLGSKENDNKPYRVTASIKNKTLFDEVIKPKNLN